MERQVTSIKIDPVLWKEFKKYCIDHDANLSDKLEEMIKHKVTS